MSLAPYGAGRAPGPARAGRVRSMEAVLPTRFLSAAALAGLLALAACGAPPPPPAAPPDPSAVASAGHGGGHGEGHGSSAPGLYAVQSGPLGVVATDAEGHLLYRFEDDTTDPPTSNCTGSCTETWLPLTVPDGVEPELLGVDGDLVGRYTRPDGGSQLTLAGRPLYRHRDDTGGLLTAGAHGEGGVWFAVTPTGEKAEAP